MIKDLTERLRGGAILSRTEAKNAVLEMRNGASKLDMFNFLYEYDRRSTSDELVGLTQGMLEDVPRFSFKFPVYDTCSTGGSGKPKVNIGTGAAIVDAAAGLSIAKHGNRSNSHCGSADVLEEMTYDIDHPPEHCRTMIEKTGFAFFYVRTFHPELKTLAAVRKEFTRTPFNYIGPLCNPAYLDGQVIGVSDPELCPTYAEAVQELGVKRAMIVNSKGLDEISVCDNTDVYEVTSGSIDRYEIIPEDLGIQRWKRKELLGGDAATNAKILKAALSGEKGAPRDAIALTAAAVFKIAGKAADLREGLDIAYSTIDSGKATRKRKQIVSWSRK